VPKKILYCVGTKPLNTESYSSAKQGFQHSYYSKSMYRTDTNITSYSNNQIKNKKYNISRDEFLESFINSVTLRCFNQKLVAQRYAKFKSSSISGNTLNLSQEYPIYIVELDIGGVASPERETLEFTADYIKHKEIALILPVEDIIKNINFASLLSAEVSINRVNFKTIDWDILLNETSDKECACRVM
jgi:hypothetical protein